MSLQGTYVHHVTVEFSVFLIFLPGEYKSIHNAWKSKALTVLTVLVPD